MSIDSGLLAEDLRRLTAHLESELASKTSADPAVKQLRDEYDSALIHHLTAKTWQVWLGDRIARAATAWVLATVIIRFCEDNDLLDISFVKDPSPGESAVHAVDRLRRHPALATVFGGAGNSLWRMRPGPEADAELLAFWRRRTPDGALVHDFTDESRSTGFLAILHSTLDESATQSYGQVPTPWFVVDLIHDLTLEPALAEIASDAVRLSGFRFADPACGTGGFLLGAYERLFRRWSEVRPGMSAWQRAARALRSVHGCDIDPCAVLVSRFRLLMAAMNSTGEGRLDDVPDLQVVVATGDSLLHGRPVANGVPRSAGLDSAADLDVYAARQGLLGLASYHVVTTNPPYVSVKDKALFAAYRDAYESCGGPYALSVPFTELAFRLALPGRDAGRVGLLTSNSFMKREFGRHLVERFLPTVEISHVIDTSGAYLPGHGTPTAVLVGRNRVPGPGTPVHVVVGRRGEPQQPAEADKGVVWQALRALAFKARAKNEWAESYPQDRAQLRAFPWTLTPSDAQAALRRMETGQRLKDRVVRIGYAANTGSDDLFCASAGAFRRAGAEEGATVPVLTGSEVRDWSADPALKAFFPRSGHDRTPVDLRQLPGHHRRLWPYRTVLRKRPGAKKTAPWYDWHQITSGWDMHPWSIVFPWVATHPHFSLVRGSAVPLNSAPEIKLASSGTEASHLELLGVLNSSAVCFWLKQMSQSKGQPRADQLRGGEAWEKIYEFTSTRLLDLPLPSGFPLREAEELDSLAVESRRVLAEVADPGSRLTHRFLAEAENRWHALRSRMIAVQEELDWRVYALYGLVADDGQLTTSGDVPGIALGERAFEIVLAGRVVAGEARTTWFDRHGTQAEPGTPESWPSAYRDLVERRVHAIQENPWLTLLEQPEHKRRWAAPPWSVLVHGILRDRLLELCESSWLWHEQSPGGPRPVARTVRQLADILGKDEDFTELTELYSPGSSTSETLLTLLADEHVPQAAPLRYKASGLVKRRLWEELWEAQRRADGQGLADTGVPHDVPPRFAAVDFLRPSYWRQRGKFDVPNERFVSFAPTASPLSPTTTIGWAGWNAYERASVVLDLLESDAHAHTQRPESALPLLGALAELLPWVAEYERRPDQDHAVEEGALRRAYHERLARIGLTEEDVNSWRPPAPRRGRPRRNG
ncbi:BREX-2 system adenine-specific DNA-methyltransferase PglX [Streptomyces sp. NPDC002920]